MRSTQETTTSRRCCVTVSTAAELRQFLLVSRVEGWRVDTPCSSACRNAEMEAGLEIPVGRGEVS